MNDTDLAFASIEQVAALIRRRKVSPVQLTNLILGRIERLNPKLNAYLTVTAELALAQAKKAEAELFAPRGRKSHRDRGPLHGIPISLKDNIYTAGIRTTAGSKILGKFFPLHDARVVSLLWKAGAVLLGKTNMHEFAYGVTSNNPHYGPVRNPWDLERIPGGSSGGSAAAVAAGLCYASVGTDTGGSIRIPAALCGIAGLKPTLGRVSCEGVVPLSPLLDCAGPLARSALDAAIVLGVICDRRQKEPHPDYVRKLAVRKKKFRLGLPNEFFFDVLQEEVREIFDEAIRDLEKIGAETTGVSIPLLAETEDAGNQIAWAEATHYHQQEGYYPARSTEYSEDVRTRLEMGTKVAATGYLRAHALRRRFIAELAAVMQEKAIDAVVVPATSIAAPLIGEEKTRIGSKDCATRALLLRLNRPANLSGSPAISLPCGFTRTGLPVGLQFIGRDLAEQTLLQIAHSYQRATDWHLRRPPI
jgi:aspartyl-tRNA(Asn)/glutamyl-tRNA(Gln) amidotransferase subunit A